MSNPTALAILLLLSAAIPAPADDGAPALSEKGWIYSWDGTGELPADLPSPPYVNAPDPKLGNRRELVFANGEQVATPLARRTLGQFTIALYLRPVQRAATESLIFCGSLETDGFLLYKMHSNWGFGAGDGTAFAKRHMGNRAEFLAREKWQHLAVTFDHGMIRYYRDGLLSASGRIRARQIVIPADARLLIGGSAAGMKAFQGSMAGIVLIDRCLAPDEIPRLMARINP